MRVFDCLRHASMLANQRTNFKPRAHHCIFISYSVGMKAYQLHDFQSHQIVISRDIVFHEEFFPFINKIASTDSEINNLFRDFVLSSPTTDSTHDALKSNIGTNNALVENDDVAAHPSTNSLVETNSEKYIAIEMSNHQVTYEIPLTISITDYSCNDVTEKHQKTSAVDPPLRRSTRNHNRPNFLQDYHCNSLLDQPTK